MITLCISDGKKYYYPPVKGGLTWSTERKLSPGTVKFTIVLDGLPIDNGLIVMINDNDIKVFFGFIFSYEPTKEGLCSITAYDQLRYFKNKDTYIFTGTASDFLRLLAKDFHLNLGTVVDTKLSMKRIEQDSELFTMMDNAIQETTLVDGTSYVLYDDYGKLCLQPIENLRTNLLITQESGHDYKYKVSVDESTYNQIKLAYENEDAGTRDIYIAKDTDNINKYGLLQHYESIKNPKTAKARANGLLKLYNCPTRSLSLQKVFGDSNVRAGKSVIVPYTKEDGSMGYHYMLVESAKHTYDGDYHYMDIKLLGGDINS